MAYSIKHMISALKKEKDPETMRRMSAVMMVLDTDTSADRVAKLFSRDPTSIRKWVRDFTAGGPEALRDIPRTGRPPSISPKQMDRCMQWAFDQEGVTPQQMQQHIADKTGRTFHITYVRKIMHEYRLSQMAPTLVHINAAKQNAVRMW